MDDTFYGSEGAVYLVYRCPYLHAPDPSTVADAAKAGGAAAADGEAGGGLEALEGRDGGGRRGRHGGSHCIVLEERRR